MVKSLERQISSELPARSLKEDEASPLLPRNAWKSQLTFLKAILQAKLALDQAETDRQLSTTDIHAPLTQQNGRMNDR